MQNSLTTAVELSDAKRLLLERMLRGDGPPSDGRPEPLLPCPSGARVQFRRPMAHDSTARLSRDMRAEHSRLLFEGGPPARLAPPRVRQACFEDYEQIYQLESTYFRDSLTASDRGGLFVNNPLWSRLGSNWPIGWVLETSAGRIVGSLNNIPTLYRFCGQEFTCANGHCWAVIEQYRGYAPMLMDEYFRQNEAKLFISSKVGIDATPIWTAFATRVPAGNWDKAAYIVTNYREFARKALHMKGIPLAAVLATPAAAALRLKDAVLARPIPAGSKSVDFTEADGFDSRFDTFWRELVRQNPDRLLAVRDREALCWHFGIPMRAKRLWIFTAARKGLLQAYCVLKQHTRPQGLRSVKLVDYQTLDCGEDLLPGLLRAALRRCAVEDNCILEHHGCGLTKMHMFDEIAPYRAKKAAWSFYYHTRDANLGTALNSPEAWDPSEYDGDASYK